VSIEARERAVRTPSPGPCPLRLLLASFCSTPLLVSSQTAHKRDWPTNNLWYSTAGQILALSQSPAKIKPLAQRCVQL
jgi:uncharacterized OsmC-like protein